MKNLETWLEEYEFSHQHPCNRAIHKFAVPAIVASIIGMISGVKIGIYGFNAAHVAIMLVSAYYFMLAPRLALGMLFASFFAAVIWTSLEEHASVAIGWWSASIFVFAWILQFIGHAFEGKRPSFFKDLQFLLIGPLWTLQHVYRYLGLRS